MKKQPQTQQPQQAVEKSIKVEISPKDLRILKAGEFKLCFAKKVGNNNFNVVWQSYSRYLEINTLSWSPKYEVFCTLSHKYYTPVVINSNSISPEPGYIIVINSAGILELVPSDNPSDGIVVKNEFRPVYIGLSQFSSGIDGQLQATPIYLSPQVPTYSAILLNPIEKVLVWFEQGSQTSTLFSGPVTNAIEVDLTNTNQITLSFANERWSTK
ncbi:MAG: hypothetical protein AAGG75_26925 [Bacteroidota bacterium]